MASRLINVHGGWSGKHTIWGNNGYVEMEEKTKQRGRNGHID